MNLVGLMGELLRPYDRSNGRNLGPQKPTVTRLHRHLPIEASAMAPLMVTRCRPASTPWPGVEEVVTWVVIGCHGFPQSHHQNLRDLSCLTPVGVKSWTSSS
jgi:hypothetical protein